MNCSANDRGRTSFRTPWRRPLSQASLKALELIASSGGLRNKLFDNTRFFRDRMKAVGFNIAQGEHPIVPIMIGEAEAASRTAELLLERGVYVVAFSYPVVPQGKARIRVQISAAHTREELEFAVKKFRSRRSDRYKCKTRQETPGGAFCLVIFADGQVSEISRRCGCHRGRSR